MVLDNKLKRFVSLLFLAYICYAFFTMLLGSEAPLMMRFYNISEAQQGFITTILSVGGITSAIICSLFGERFKKLKVLGYGLAILALSTVLIGLAPPYYIVIICALFAGIAYTLIDIMVSSTFTQYFSSSSKTLLPMAHMFFGIGAMVGPYMMTAIVNPDIARSFTLPFLLIGGLTAVTFGLYSLTARKVSADVQSAGLQMEKGRPADVFRAKKFWLVLLGGLLYCCFTTGILAWYPTYFNETKGLSLDMAGLMLTLFFAGSLVMRFFGPFFFARIKPQKIFIWFSLLSALSMVFALTLDNIVLIALFTVLSGAFQALNMVALIFIGCALFPTRHASATSVAVFAYNIGGMISPVLLGVLARNTGFQFPMLLSCGLFAAGITVIGFLSVKYKKELQNA